MLKRLLRKSFCLCLHLEDHFIKLSGMSADSLDPNNGAEIAQTIFDLQEKGHAETLAGLTMLKIPALRAAFTHAAVRVAEIAVELELSEKQTIALYQVYTLGACTTAMMMPDVNS